MAPPGGFGESSPPRYHSCQSSLLVQAGGFCVGSLGVLWIFQIGQGHCNKESGHRGWRAQRRKQKERFKATVHSAHPLPSQLLKPRHGLQSRSPDAPVSSSARMAPPHRQSVDASPESCFLRFLFGHRPCSGASCFRPAILSPQQSPHLPPSTCHKAAGVTLTYKQIGPCHHLTSESSLVLCHPKP